MNGSLYRACLDSHLCNLLEDPGLVLVLEDSVESEVSKDILRLRIKKDQGSSKLGRYQVPVALALSPTPHLAFSCMGTLTGMLRYFHSIASKGTYSRQLHPDLNHPGIHYIATDAAQ